MIDSWTVLRLDGHHDEPHPIWFSAESQDSSSQISSFTGIANELPTLFYPKYPSYHYTKVYPLTSILGDWHFALAAL